MEKKRWRIIHVNTNIPAASFYAYEIEGDPIAGYDKSMQDYLRGFAASLEFKMGAIGDSYSDWQDSEIPTLLTKATAIN